MSLLGERSVLHGMEPLDQHLARFGHPPAGGAHAIAALEQSELRGRGGAGFPVGAKWRTVAQQRTTATVLVNGAEGEPLSRKDHALMTARPHLVLDGAGIAAQSVGATQIVLYVGAAHADARGALNTALRQRPPSVPTRFVDAPARYIAGEETAAVHAVNAGLALPTSTPPRPFVRGVGAMPTLVQNVESLAHAALIARGRDSRSLLATVSGHGGPATVVEVPYGSPLHAAVTAAGGDITRTEAVLLGGYFGRWVAAGDAAQLPLDSAALRLRGQSLGAGIIALLPQEHCGAVVTAHIASYLAGESGQQCGPCVFGLRAIAEALQRIAGCTAQRHDLVRIRTWASEVRGRGACKHPDGAASLVLSALDLFDNEFTTHLQQQRCSRGGAPLGVSMWTWTPQQ